jgi:two-component system cell cycle response regulator DivK
MTRVLIIEDNESSQKLMSDLLVREGYQVEIASNADAGIAAAMKSRFDVVVMDIQLPGTDGLTATRILRSSPNGAGLRILAVTAHAMRGDERRILSGGCDAYVAKPIAYKEFLAKIASLVAPNFKTVSGGS